MPPETTLLFKALVVAAVCLVQSPSFRAKALRRGPAGPPREARPPVGAGR
ncbi:hypothetical protein ACFFV7_04850 [Nonomuraea spiralis]|uniref:Uncharacterized protein n=1 Tax=Nonomuraea spiralis TaxID=46182 RepID=A0ABV5I873_9ACTN|nr:hypothetical protein [Nonomuraea spiralis]GGT09756.1 hypothetical protein GCM10010176_062750 [Nonomuraea spiralis]